MDGQWLISCRNLDDITFCRQGPIGCGSLGEENARMGGGGGPVNGPVLQIGRQHYWRWRA